MGKKKKLKKINQEKLQKSPVTTCDWQLSDRQLWILTFITAAIYFLFSQYSNGFYQHDEVGHFLNMRRFWNDPTCILGNWAKTGYKLFFVIPALLGTTVVHILNCFIAAFTCFMAYKLTKQLDSKVPLLAFILLATQPFWIQLSFRNYAETTAALLLILSVYFHYKDKPLLAALLLSYNVNVRQELFSIWALYILYLLYKRQWIPILAMISFPILYNISGWIATGDILYLKNQMFGTIEHIQSGYGSGAMGFWHYPKMSIVVFGAVAVFFIIVFLGQWIFYKKSWLPFLFIPALVFFGQYCIFQIQSVQIGPSGAGNLRYMIIISPLIAVLASLAVERATDQESRKKLLFFLAPLAICVILFMKYQHNNLRFLEQIDIYPVITILLLLGSLFITMKKKLYIYTISIIAILFALVSVKPIQLSPEDKVVKRVVAWAKKNKIEQNYVMTNHSLFLYFYGKDHFEFKNGASRINKTSVLEAPVGATILWDSHYSYRPNRNKNHVNYDYFTKQPKSYKTLFQPLMSSDRRFGYMAFQKIGEDTTQIKL